MTKIFNFALKMKGGVVGRMAHAKSSDPATPSKFGTCTFSNHHMDGDIFWMTAFN